MRRRIREIFITSEEQLLRELRRIKVHPLAEPILLKKGLYKYLLVKDVSPAIGNILKQQMLSVGGEAAVAQGCVDCSIAKTDALLIGTTAQLLMVKEKLKSQPFAVFKELVNELEKMLSAENKYLQWQCGKRIFTAGKQPLIMGVLNVTPDSFSDGGKYFSFNEALRRAEELIKEGADIIDIGGESSRPGAEPVTAEVELQRVLPVIKAVKEKYDAVISIDTYKFEVAEQAVYAGAEIVNDITGLRHSPEMKELIARTGAGIVIMHMQGTPQNMQQSPTYEDVVEEIGEFLEAQIQEAKNAGVNEEQIVIDPGIGFGKTLQHNLTILANLQQIKKRCQRPLLIGVSRKSFIGKLLGDIPPAERVYGSIGSAIAAVRNGADIVRVHDVRAPRESLNLYREITNFSPD
ncbi:MAG: dihydropteroate synthase [Candidatus Sumerlaeia bacterium]|nr:dihydropteroate synthase [Candidatus Sumerlaeia bacterium]